MGPDFLSDAVLQRQRRSAGSCYWEKATRARTMSRRSERKLATLTGGLRGGGGLGKASCFIEATPEIDAAAFAGR
ncbi:hypothetical protein PUN28_009552 [Cardiocondyla obscurior]|uniref:Uncharacterized protein n=1 Tax=Cardiocondyla obscurior TaxID=286306 RepID=A0AAW2FVZ8_9HYME